jgi:hypothetical protein
LGKQKKTIPSLLEPQSRGGQSAKDGFEFQSNYLLSQIPFLLQQEGFISVLNEGIGDIEISSFSPEVGVIYECIEVKKQTITLSIFRSEVERFYSIYQGSPNTYIKFHLVGLGFSEDVQPIIRGLDRIKQSFYQKDLGVYQNSYSDFVQLVTDRNMPSEYADFLLNYVLLIRHPELISDSIYAIFWKDLAKAFPDYQKISDGVKESIYLALKDLINIKRDAPISREEIENIIYSRSDIKLLRLPVKLHTANTHVEDKDALDKLVVNWERFSGGQDRSYPDSNEWNSVALKQLILIREFVLSHRANSNRVIHLSGMRRLSLSLAIGSIFSATSGFNIQLEHPSILWRTDQHANGDESLSINIEYPKLVGEDVVVCIGVLNDIKGNVENFIYRENSNRIPIPLLNITCSEPIESPQQANYLVSQIKKAIQQALLTTQAKKIHLFCATPAFIALFLGHRLNATAPVQCYEYIPPTTYLQTCLLLP